MRTLAPLLGVAVVVAAACVGRSGKDLDVDGITGKVDGCPDAPETQNGWRDEDGCPDRLARLMVTVLRAGEPVADAAVSMPGAPPQQTDAQGRAVFLELLPVARGVFVQVAVQGRVQDVRAPLDEGENAVIVELSK